MRIYFKLWFLEFYLKLVFCSDCIILEINKVNFIEGIDLFNCEIEVKIKIFFEVIVGFYFYIWVNDFKILVYELWSMS